MGSDFFKQTPQNTKTSALRQIFCFLTALIKNVVECGVYTINIKKQLLTPISGKSTLSKKIAEYFDGKIIGRDEIYFATDKLLELEHTPDEDDHSLWNNMWPLVLQGTKNHLLLGNSVVIDDNCLYLKQRDELRAVAKEAGVQSILIFLDIPTEVLKQRKEENKISKARHDVPSKWLAEDSDLFERPAEAENPIVYKAEMSFEDFVSNLQNIKTKRNPADAQSRDYPSWEQTALGTERFEKFPPFFRCHFFESFHQVSYLTSNGI